MICDAPPIAASVLGYLDCEIANTESISRLSRGVNIKLDRSPLVMYENYVLSNHIRGCFKPFIPVVLRNIMYSYCLPLPRCFHCRFPCNKLCKKCNNWKCTNCRRNTHNKPCIMEPCLSILKQTPTIQNSWTYNQVANLRTCCPIAICRKCSKNNARLEKEYKQNLKKNNRISQLDGFFSK